MLKYSISADGFTPGYRNLALVTAALVALTLVVFLRLGRAVDSLAPKSELQPS